MLATVKIRLVLIVSAIASSQVQAQAEAAPVPEPHAKINYVAPDSVPRLPVAPKRFRAPQGFAGHTWGDRRNTFPRLPVQALAIRAAWTRGRERPREYACTDIGSRAGGLLGECTVGEIVKSTRVDMEGGGFHVLSEYALEGQGFKFSETSVLLYPVVYQFCAHWTRKKAEVPENIEELNRFCGMRMLFDTESRSQLRDLPDDHVTRYELVLAELIANYGKPAGYMWRGRVTIEPFDEVAEASPSTERKFNTWRWCPASYEGLETRCDSSIVLSIDPDYGRGIVLFSSPALWQYAYARETGFSRPDPLFTLLHALQPKERERLRQLRVAEEKAATEKRERLQAAKAEKAAKKKAAKEKAAAEKAAGQVRTIQGPSQTEQSSAP
jgi:hypothetical protein